LQIKCFRLGYRIMMNVKNVNGGRYTYPLQIGGYKRNR
jgi:uncharacterized Tic20 family protein